jgi:hypothetical protein
VTTDPETRPPADPGTPAPEPIDLKAQAREMRRALSTADIIMVEDRDTRVSRKTYIYLAGAAGCLVLLMALFLMPATRATLADRTHQIAQATAGAPPATDQSASADHEFKPAAPADEDGEPVLGGNFTVSSGAPPAPAAAAAAAAPPPAPQVLRAPQRPTPPPQPAPAAARPAAAKPTAAPATPAGDAYRLLLAQRPAFANLVTGGSGEYRYVEHQATAKTARTFLLDFTFQKGADGEPVHFLWEVDLETQAIRPIGLAAARFDRRQPR